jgi:hypothetical protein
MGDFTKNSFSGSFSMGIGEKCGILLRIQGSLEPDKQEAFRHEISALASKYSLTVRTFDVTPE